MSPSNLSRSWLFIVILILMITCLVLIYPKQGFIAAERGVAIWWEVLFPSLFPFFVISELLLGFGIVHFVGALLDPMMRPVFRVPGIGGFVMAMGFASGYPIGARLTAHLWEHKLVNRIEGERLVAFTTTSDPIFLIGVVSIGFFHNAQLAIIFAIAHYGGAVILGLLVRFYGGPSKAPIPDSSESAHSNIVIRAFEAMHKARMEDGRTVSLMLKEAIHTSLKLIFVVGGLVVFFSVTLELLSLANIMDALYAIVNLALQWFYIPKELSEAIVNGIFEVTLGARTAGTSGEGLALVHKVAIGAFILSWSGLSVHAQIVSLLTHTNIRYRPIMLARLCHSLISTIIVYLIWDFMWPRLEATAAMLPFIPGAETPPFTGLWPWGISASVSVFLAVLFLIPIIALTILLLRKTALLLFYKK